MEIPNLIAADDIHDWLREIPELRATIGCTQSPPHTLDVFSHTLQVVNYIRWGNQINNAPNDHPNGGITRQEITELAALCHDLGKPERRMENEYGKVSFHDHPAVGAVKAANIAQRMGLCLADCLSVSTLVQMHLRPAELLREWEVKDGEMIRPTDRALRRLKRDAGDFLPELMALALADWYGKKGEETDPEEITTYALRLSTMMNRMEEL